MTTYARLAVTPAPIAAAPPAASPARLQIGAVPIDAVTFAGALDGIEALVTAGNGGAVYTPNVDHVVLAEDDDELRRAYAAARLSLVDGVPVLWASRLMGRPLPEKISGSDLIRPLVERAARRGWAIYLLGGAAGVAVEAAARLALEHGVRVVGAEGPRIDLSPAGVAEALAAAERVRRSGARLVLVALGAPKQELWLHRHAAALGPVVGVAVGASLDFVAGRVRRAPRWMSRAGLEWAFRLAQEPRRLWRRYLVQDPRFVAVLLRTMCARRLPPRAGARGGGTGR